MIPAFLRRIYYAYKVAEREMHIDDLERQRDEFVMAREHITLQIADVEARLYQAKLRRPALPKPIEPRSQA